MRISNAENLPKSGHNWSMSNDFKLIVYFSCPHCATIYTARQEEQPGRHPGTTFIAVCAALRSTNGLGSIISLIGN